MENIRIIHVLEVGGGKKLCEIVDNPGCGFEMLVRVAPNVPEHLQADVTFFVQKYTKAFEMPQKSFADLMEDAEKRGFIRESQGAVAIVQDYI